jgi:hypothetical protein
MVPTEGRWADKKIIMLNGPKRVGKGEAVKVLLRYLPNSVSFHLAADLERAMIALFDIPMRVQIAVKAPGAAAKDQPIAELDGMTWREGLIKMSEKAFKPAFGEDFFGKLMLRKILRTPSQYIVLDSIGGFIPELEPIIDSLRQHFGDSRSRLKLIRINREGHTFEGDSRSWLSDDRIVDLNVNGRIRIKDVCETFDIDNRHELEMYHMQVRRAANILLGITSGVSE